MGNRQSVFNYRQRRRDKHAAAPAKSALTITKSRLSPIRTNKSAKHHREELEDRPKMKTSSSYPDSNRPVVDDTTIVVDGRTYQNVNSKYYLPNDELEQDRMTNLVIIDADPKWILPGEKFKCIHTMVAIAFHSEALFRWKLHCTGARAP